MPLKSRTPTPSNRVARQRFGAHMSVAGGLENAFAAGVAAGCDCLQIFVKNQRQWAAAPLRDEQIAAYREAERRTGLGPVVAHATYLLNPASPDRAMRRRTVRALIAELRRCEALGVPYLVLHPGSHMGAGAAAGIRRAAASLNEVHAATGGDRVQVLLETTAGQGNSIGCEIGHLAGILDGLKDPRRVGVCLDTCHLFAAGYDLRDGEAYERCMEELAGRVGVQLVRCIHVNDSKGACGSRLDRHEHIGKGRLGRAAFARLVNDTRFQLVPRILETPKGQDGRGVDLDRVNLARLRRLTSRCGTN